MATDNWTGPQLKDRDLFFGVETVVYIYNP